MQLKPGMRLCSCVDSTELIVVRSPAHDVDLRCGGRPVMELGADRPVDATPDPAQAGGTQIGKRYTDTAVTLEVLCTKAGDGGLSVGDEPLVLKEAKLLPSSD